MQKLECEIHSFDFSLFSYAYEVNLNIRHSWICIRGMTLLLQKEFPKRPIEGWQFNATQNRYLIYADILAIKMSNRHSVINCNNPCNMKIRWLGSIPWISLERPLSLASLPIRIRQNRSVSTYFPIRFVFKFSTTRSTPFISLLTCCCCSAHYFYYANRTHMRTLFPVSGNLFPPRLINGI